MKAFGNIEKDSQIRAVASGAISSGKPVAINSDGTVSEVSGADASLGTEGAFNSLTSSFLSTVFDSSNNKHIITYRQGNSIRYVVATVAANGSVSFGTDAQAVAGDYSAVGSAFDSTNNRIVIVFKNGATYAMVGSLSGTTVTWGSVTEVHSGSSAILGISFDSTAEKVIISYIGSSSYGTARVGTVSGTSISFGTAVVFNSGTTGVTRPVYDSTNNRTVIAFKDGGDSNKGKAVVGTVSGTDISFGSEVVFESGQVKDSGMGLAFDSDTGKVVIAYRQNAESGGSTDFKRGTAVVGTVSGTSISFGTPVAFDNTGDYGENTSNSVIYDTNAKKVLVVYPRTVDGSYSNRGFVFPLAVSGTTVVADTPTDFAGATVGYPAISFDSNVNKNLIAFYDGGNSEYGTAVSFSPASTTLTSENYIGMLSGVVKDASLSQANGTPVEYGDANTAHQSATFDSNSNKVVVAFRGTSDHGKAVVGTVNGTDNSISFGTVVTFEAASQLNNAITFDSSNNKVVIAYRDEGNSNYGTAIVGTVSGTDISFGSPAVFNTGRSDSISIAFDSSNNKVVIAYRDNGNSNYGTAIVGTVSGTGISFGSEVVFKSATTGVTSTVFDSNSNKVAILYNDGAGKAVVGTVSGTGISFGSEATFESGAVDGLSTAFDSNLNKIVAAYRDEGNSNHGTSAIGTISGTDITFGTPVVFESAGILSTGTAFDTGVNKVNIFYKDGGNSDYGTVIVGTVSGTTISFGTPVVYEEATTSAFAATFDSNSKRVIGVNTDGGNSTKGTAVVFCNAGTIGTVRGEVADGGNAVIDSTNTISRNQSGLTAGQTLFVQTDGTLSETADDPSVTAGTAISATELIVKG